MLTGVLWTAQREEGVSGHQYCRSIKDSCLCLQILVYIGFVVKLKSQVSHVEIVLDKNQH